MQPQIQPDGESTPDRPSRNSDDGETVVVGGQRGSYRCSGFCGRKGYRSRSPPRLFSHTSMAELPPAQSFPPPRLESTLRRKLAAGVAAADISRCRVDQ
jgi:hypothetical protein